MDAAAHVRSNAFRAEYARYWVRIKRRWGLTADEKEESALRELLGQEAQLPEKAAVQSGCRFRGRALP